MDRSHDTYMTLRIPPSILEGVTACLDKRPMTRTAWILEAMMEKIKRDKDK